MRRSFILGGLCFSLLIFSGSLAQAQGINISLVGSHKPPQSGFGDVWGDGNIACMGVWLSSGYNAGWGTGIYDISNPNSPALLTTYNYGSGVGNRFEQGVIRSNILYLGSWGGSGNGSGLHILSLANPALPVLLSRITKNSAGTVTNGFSDVHTLWVERNYLYEAAHNAGIVSVKVFDISNPALPVYLSDIVTTNTTKVHQMTVGMKGTNVILYTSGWGGFDNGNLNSYGQTDMWDVNHIGTQPARWLGRIYSGYNSHSSCPTPDGNTLVVCRETPGGEVSFYDISTPPNPSPNSITNPVPLAVISPARMGIEGDIPHNPVIISNLLFLSWYQNGLQIFDITDRTKPVRVGAYDTYPNASSSSYQGNWGIYPKLGLNKLLVSDINNGFFILDASAVLTGTNNYPPLLITSPSSVFTNAGNPVTLSAVFTGSSLKYQWRFNNAILPGATDSSLVFSHVQASNSGNYFVEATNANGAVTSGVASLTVNVPAGSVPSVTGQPENASVYAGNPASFTVAVSGFAPFSFQWRFNGADIPGATTNSLSLDNVQPQQVGVYSLVVSNFYGTATSSNAALSIIDSPYLNSIQATPGGRSALISWKSTVPSDSQVQFDVASGIIAVPDGAAAQGASFGNGSYIDRTLTTNHTVLLTGLNLATRYSFQVISSNDTNSFLSGVYQFTTAGAPIILDNTNSDVTFAGNWSTSVNVTTYYGSNYRYSSSTVAGASNVTFRPTLTTPGNYDVSVWYPAGTDRAVDAPYAISYNGGSNTFLVNQKLNGGQWNVIGANLPFAAGNAGFVRLSNKASASVVIADAVQFAYRDAQETPADNSVPAWWANFYGVVDPLDDPDLDGFSNAQEYMLGTSPTDASSHLLLEAQSAGNAANITFWPYIGNRTYELLYKTNLADASWRVLPPGAITPTPYGHGIFSLSTDSAPQGFYRLGVHAAAQGDFSGKISIPQGDAFNGFAEAACGVNRVYVKPRR